MRSCLGFAVVIGVLLILSTDWEQPIASTSHDDVFSNDKLFAVSASDLKHTVVAASLSVPLEQGKNVLWCGTFQLVWNETCTLVGEDLHFIPEPPIVAALNKKTFTKNDLDAASYVALAGFVKDSIHQRIRQSLQEKFGGAAKPRLVPPETVTPRPQDIVAYAYLFKNLQFAVPFERFSKPLHFGNSDVSAFGMGDAKSTHMQMLPQVLILNYVGPDDFVIELKTKSQGDRLILAKIQPKLSLAETVADVQIRSTSAAPQTAIPGDELAVPKFNFDITREYSEIEGKHLILQNPAVARDLVLLSAMQDIRFQMDEKGIRLKSESHMALGCSRAAPPTHVMLFDKPFLTILERTNSAAPYFVLWVDNPELLVPW